MKLHIDITMHRANLWNGTLHDPMKTVQHITTCRFQTVSFFEGTLDPLLLLLN